MSRFIPVASIISALLLLASFSNVALGTTYYVSSSQGNDSFNGLSDATPFASIGKVNGLTLAAGDNVLFRCGDTWRAEMLVLTRSGSSGSPITYSSYPPQCPDKPVLSGSREISGWSLYSTNIYMADLSAGGNGGSFPLGINQLFRNGERLPLGRWPNLGTDDGGINYHNGYAVIDGQPAGNRLTDNQLPAASWTGGTVHIKGMRWYILNRVITAASATSLTLNSDAGCWGGNCTGWGYFINNHLQTLDRTGEWYYDSATSRVYLYSDSGIPGPGEIEGSVILKDDERYWGLVLLGRDLNEHISHVVIDNLAIINSFRNGISTPTNLKASENSYLTIRNTEIRNMDSTGIKLATWVYAPTDGRLAGWRGGHHQEIADTLIDGANHFGIDTYSRESLFTGNTIKNIGVIDNLGQSGLGCGDDGSGGACTESGDGFRIKVDKAADTGHSNSLTTNRLEAIAYNGVDIFGHDNSLVENVIDRPCITKGDCGGVRSYGSGSLSSTAVYDLTLRDNIILDSEGNTDGAHPTYRPLFGFGLYIDNYSRNVAADGNTIARCTSHGILYQNSSGTVTANTLYNNVNDISWGAQLHITSGSTVTTARDNILYGLQDRARSLSTETANLSGSDRNYFFNPYDETTIASGGAERTLAGWQTYSGMDGNSVKNWFTLEDGTPPLSELFVNDTASVATMSLGNRRYLDLDRNPVESSLTLQPYSSRVLVFDSLAAPDLADVITILQVLAGETPTASPSLGAGDTDGNGRLDLSDAIAILQDMSE